MNVLEFQSLSDTDIQAILTALPLIFDPQFQSSDQQAKINMASGKALIRKLTNRETAISPKELSLLCASVIAAKDFLSGRLPLSVAPEDRAELSRYFFSYNKLAPSCTKTLEYLVNDYL